MEQFRWCFCAQQQIWPCKSSDICCQLSGYNERWQYPWSLLGLPRRSALTGAYPGDQSWQPQCRCQSFCCKTIRCNRFGVYQKWWWNSRCHWRSGRDQPRGIQLFTAPGQPAFRKNGNRNIPTRCGELTPFQQPAFPCNRWPCGTARFNRAWF